MNGFVQTRCPRCGNAAWGHIGQASPCHTCGAMLPAMNVAPGTVPENGVPMASWGPTPAVVHQAPHLARPATGSSPQPPAQHANGSGVTFKLAPTVKPGGGGLKLRVIGGAILAVVAAVGGFLVKRSLTTPEGMIGYAALGVDTGKPDADALYASLAGTATKWRSDAMFWSLNYQAVRADATVDTAKGAEIVYVSPYASESTSKKTRSDSLRKYAATASGVRPNQYGWNEPVKDLAPHPAPACSIKDVVAVLAKQGLTGDKTVRITFDPRFADFYAWHVIGTDPQVDALYSWDDCSLVK